MIAIGPKTKLVVRKHIVPIAWLFSGPTASIAVTPKAAGAPAALEIDFHPVAKTFTGDISSIAQGKMGVLERKIRQRPSTLRLRPSRMMATRPRIRRS